MSDSLMKRKDLEYEMLKKAEEDMSFRKKLIENPKAAAEQFGLNLPDDLKFQVVEEKKGERILVVPESIDESELSDMEMTQAAGGFFQGTGIDTLSGGANSGRTDNINTSGSNQSIDTKLT